MKRTVLFASNLSLRRIAGFACNQGFVFFLFYLGTSKATGLGDSEVVSLGSYAVDRLDLVGTYFFMAVAFFLLRVIPKRIKKVVLARPFLLLYALMLAVGSLVPYFIKETTSSWLLTEGVLLGISCALLLAAWGRSFGESPAKVSVPEVFLASFAAALFVLLVSILPVSRADLVFRILPFINVATLMVSPQTDFSLRSTMISDDTSRDTVLLSAKIVAGTVLFGMAAGCMETFSAGFGATAAAASFVAFVLFAAFTLGTLSLLLSDGFGKGAALNKAYRLAIFIMLMGHLLIHAPFFSGSIISGEAIVLAGQLGLSAVLISLFLVLASITDTSVLSSFARGFAALFSGRFVGLVVADAFNTAQSNVISSYSLVIVAGILVLFSYVFLFTERDFNEFSEIVTKTDSFEDRCQTLIEQYSLSAREAEVLPYILKGRTSERISQELFIAKSTVDTHLRRIYTKAGVHSRQELIDLSE